MIIPERIIFYLCLFVLSSTLSCGLSGGGSPSDIVNLYLDRMDVMDFDGAKKYCTERTASMLDMARAMHESMGSPENPDRARREDIEIQSEAIDGDQATVVTINKATQEVTSLSLVKVDGKWKIDQERLK